MSVASASAMPDGDAVAGALARLAEDEFMYQMVDRVRAQLVARIVDALTDKSVTYQNVEYWRADAVAHARAAGATWEQVADAMELEPAEVRALFAPRRVPAVVTEYVPEDGPGVGAC